MPVAPPPYFHDGRPTYRPSKSWSGNNDPGVLAAQSWDGVGSVGATLYWTINSGAAFQLTRVGVFLKMSAYPAVNTTLFDLSDGSNRWFKAVVNTIGQVFCAARVDNGFGGFVSFSSLTIGTCVVGEWDWVELNFTQGGGFTLFLNGAVIGPGGFVLGSNSVSQGGLSNLGAQHSVGVSMGDGKSISGGGSDAPNDGTFLRSKLRLANNTAGNGVGTIWPPLADWSGLTAPDHWYNGRGSLGAAVSLADGNGTPANLAGTYTLYSDGPFVL